MTGLRRLGKRIVIELEGDCFVLIHLMIAGRLHWKEAGAKLPGKIGLAALDFSTGTLTLTEAGSKRRAAIHLVRGAAALATHDPGGLELFETDLAAFRAALTRETHTLKRALTDPRILSGVGNAYSDEILHRARLSPVRMTRQLSEEETARLFEAARATLADWVDAAAPRGGGRVPGRGDRVPARHGGARPLRPAVSRLRRAGAAHRPRRERDQLLRALSDRGTAPGRSRAVAAAAAGLAAHPRGDGGAAARGHGSGGRPGRSRSVLRLPATVATTVRRRR